MKAHEIIDMFSFPETEDVLIKHFDLDELLFTQEIVSMFIDTKKPWNYDNFINFVFSLQGKEIVVDMRPSYKKEVTAAAQSVDKGNKS